MRVEGLYSSFSPSFEPLTYRPLADSQCDRNVFLLPAFLFQLPRSFASFFSPIGFLWCSHTSYSITLYFSLPTSVDRGDKGERYICPSRLKSRHLASLSARDVPSWSPINKARSTRVATRGSMRST